MKTKKGDSVETSVVDVRDDSVIFNVSFNAIKVGMMTRMGPDPSFKGFVARHHKFTLILIDDGSSIGFFCNMGSILFHTWIGNMTAVMCTKVLARRPRSSCALPNFVVTSLYDNLASTYMMWSYIAYIDGYIYICKICYDHCHNAIKNAFGNLFECRPKVIASCSRQDNGATSDIPDYVPYDRLCAWVARERHLPIRHLRLCGGGEGAINASGWGSPSAAVTSASTSASAANAITASPSVPSHVTWSATATGKAPKNQLEQLNTMREALFAQDGWGCQHVNQDTHWDVPTSPEPGTSKVETTPTVSTPPAWKTAVNNGTDLWEANLRNGGQPAPQPVTKTPWGHTPSTNLGGTWGEDDDAAEGGNVWTGTSAVASATPQWGSAATSGSSGGMWQQSAAGCVPKKEGDWNSGAAGTWQDPREMRGAQLSVDPREIRANSADPRDLRIIDPREQIRDMRGDPRGISGRLNGASEMWGQHHAMATAAAAAAAAVQVHMPHNKMVPQSQGAAQWTVGAAVPPKDMTLSTVKPSGWEEPSPPAQRRAVGNFDDGTSLWGQQGATRLPGVSHWKEAADIRGNAMVRPSASAALGQRVTKESIMWRNGSWDEGNTAWDEKTPTQAGAWGGDSWQKNKPNMWPEGEIEWNAAKTTSKISTAQVDLMRNSKQLRILQEMGFKKEEAEVALRVTNMNVDEALEMLNQQRGAVEPWRRHDEHSGSFDPTFPGRFPTNQATMQFPPTSAAILNNMSSIQPLQVQKYLQGSHTNPPPPGNGASFAQTQPPPPQSSGQPSTQQLRMLVQQIQMAVQAGYLNHQILNQPLAPQTLLLLNQLLNNIKQLQLTQSNMTSRSGMNGLQHSVAVTKLKQQISNLQNQITAQQAIYVKQQQSSHANAGDFVLRTPHDPIVSLQGNFSEITLNKDPQPYQATMTQQSRLNQWKLGALEKESDATDFSRAPGTTSKPTMSTASSTMSSLGLQGDGTWSTGRNVNDGWPDGGAIETENSKDWSTGQTSPSAAFTDLVPEFEPGKPWKGTQMKTIEEDPSITPGSVARSPLSITAKESDLFTGSSKTSPTDMQPISLSSSTWSFHPSTSQQNFTSTAKLTTKSNSWNDHMGQPPQTTSELWGVPVSKASRGPPPGLGATKGTVGSTTSNGWVPSSLSRGIGQQNWPSNNWGHSTWLLLKNLTPQIDGSTLRTLCMQHGPLQNFHMYLNHSIALCKYSSREEAHKAQVALNNCVLGNTTICAESPSESEVQNILQHLALPAASSSQTSGTTASTSVWRPTNQPPTARNSAPNDTWGTGSVWTQSSGGNNLWTPLETGTERGTPSNLNSFLPENLLGGELN
ncbi:protein Gawky isoform X2 [Phlebotomus argentipes]|uniref:protein Gawky isoform X2 n=1 Tax=Phlebotomus argentipes TaxID=94469 RepID=UPI0028934F35|nr:protein Gawky isoform X2 [Phlebotomus argentipes]